MSYNQAPRRRFTKAQREAFLEKHGHRCHWCKGIILPDQSWAVEHKLARELLPDASADDDDNLAPIHAHPEPCHKEKGVEDMRLIAKSNRLRRSNGPIEDRRQTRHPIRNRGFGKQHRPMQSRGFEREAK